MRRFAKTIEELGKASTVVDADAKARLSLLKYQLESIRAERQGSEPAAEGVRGAEELFSGLMLHDLQLDRVALATVMRVVRQCQALAKEAAEGREIGKASLSAESPLVVEFAGEAMTHLAATEAALSELQANSESLEPTMTLLRSFHSVYKAAGFLHLTQIAGLAEAAESVVNAAVTDKLRFNAGILSMLARTLDALRGMVCVLRELICTGDEPPPQFGLEELVAQLRGALSDANGNSYPG